MRCSWSILVVLLLLALLACWLVFYTYSSESCPEGAFPCANSSLCIPQRAICNQHNDCPLGDDENFITCVDLNGYIDEFIGNLKITNVSDICLLDAYPSECACGEGTALWCKERGLIAVPQNVSDDVTKMNLANNSILLSEKAFSGYCCITHIHLEGNNLRALPPRVFRNQTHLSHLMLQKNQLEVLPVCVFCGLQRLRWLFLHFNKLKHLNLISWELLSNLEWLELSHNEITLEHETFPSLPALKMLNLAYNKIELIKSDTFSKIGDLSELDLRNNSIQFLEEGAFRELKNLDYLDLSHNCLHTLEEYAFKSLYSLDKLQLGHNPLQQVHGKLFYSLGNLSSLDLQDIELEHIDTKMFQMIKNLDFVYFKQYYYCTYAPNVPKCSPNTDGVSSFENLLSKPIQRVTVWMVAAFTCGANVLVVLGRFTAKDENQALSFVVRNLAVSDLLMGLYLAVIAYEDLEMRGKYNNYAHQWMSSFTCTMTGITAMISSEVSVFILAFLSLERFLLITVPFSGHKKLNMTTATYSMIVIWLVGTVIAVAPVLHWRNSTRFYGTNGLCFPLHIDIPYLMGWQYSAFVFIGINTTVILLMAVVYSAMFLSIVRTRTATTTNLGDSEFAIRFFLIVLADALCWTPITVIKLLALCRIHIPGSLYAWVVVFVLPVNSALNPLLYTFTTPKYCNIIKDLGSIMTRKQQQCTKKKISADTECSLCLNKRNIFLSPLENKDKVLPVQLTTYTQEDSAINNPHVKCVGSK